MFRWNPVRVQNALQSHLLRPNKTFGAATLTAQTRFSSSGQEDGAKSSKFATGAVAVGTVIAYGAFQYLSTNGNSSDSKQKKTVSEEATEKTNAAAAAPATKKAAEETPAAVVIPEVRTQYFVIPCGHQLLYV